MAVEGAITGGPLGVWYTGAKALFGLAKEKKAEPSPGEILRAAGRWGDADSVRAVRDDVANKQINPGAPAGQVILISKIKQYNLAELDARLAQLGSTRAPAIPSPVTPAPDPRLPYPPQLSPVIVGAATVGSIPPNVTSIFEGTTTGKVLGKAKTVVDKMPKKGGSVGFATGAILVGIEAGRAIINARDKQIEEENRAFKKQQREEDAAINAKVRAIQESKEAAEKAAAKAAAEYEKRLKAADRQTEVARARQARVITRIDKQLEQADRDIENIRKSTIARKQRGLARSTKAAQKAQAAQRKAQLDKLKSAVGIGIALLGLRGNRKRSGTSANFIEQPPVKLPETELPTTRAPDYFQELVRQEQPALTRSKTKTTTKTKVCKSDTPKRKKGKCRTGFFRETPNRTTYKTWSEKPCL